MKKVLIACDHRGIAMRDKIVEWCNEHGFQPVDMGPKDAASVDYPDYAVPLCEEVAKNQDGPVVGVLVCGWGNGMAIAANKVKGIRAGLCMERVQAEYARLHNNANVLVIPAEATGYGMMAEILDGFMSTEFEGGRHSRRIGKIADYEGC